MKKPLLYILISLLIMLTACSSTPERAPEPVAEDKTYYNDYLGFSVFVPAGWQINQLSVNLAEVRGLTITPKLTEYAEGGGRLELIDLQNVADSSEAGHARFAAYAEIFPDIVDAEQYRQLFASFLTAGGGGISYTLEGQEAVMISERPATRYRITATILASDLSYTEDYYVLPIGTAFLILYVNYWPQSPASQAAAQQMLENMAIANLS